MTDAVLKFLDLFSWLFKVLRIDYPKFRALLWVKLTTENRQDKSIMQRKSNKEISNAMIWVMVIYIFMGLFAGLMLLQIQDLFVALVFIFAIIMVMTTVALISDFSTVFWTQRTTPSFSFVPSMPEPWSSPGSPISSSI